MYLFGEAVDDLAVGEYLDVGLLKPLPVGVVLLLYLSDLLVSGPIVVKFLKSCEKLYSPVRCL